MLNDNNVHDFDFAAFGTTAVGWGLLGQMGGRALQRPLEGCHQRCRLLLLAAPRVRERHLMRRCSSGVCRGIIDLDRMLSKLAAYPRTRSSPTLSFLRSPYDKSDYYV